MSTPATDADTVLQMTREFNAPRARVFKAFTDPELLRQWWSPDGFAFTDIQVDPDSGLGTRFTMVDDSTGDTYVWDMVYTDVDEPNRLVWRSIWVDGFADNRETVVTIEFRTVDGGTEISLTHEGFADKKNRDDHGAGWDGSLEKLGRFLSN